MELSYDIFDNWASMSVNFAEREPECPLAVTLAGGGCYVKYLNMFNIFVSKIPHAPTHRNKQIENMKHEHALNFIYIKRPNVYVYIQNLR